MENLTESVRVVQPQQGTIDIEGLPFDKVSEFLRSSTQVREESVRRSLLHTNEIVKMTGTKFLLNDSSVFSPAWPVIHLTDDDAPSHPIIGIS